jgi:hypothetical protein
MLTKLIFLSQMKWPCYFSALLLLLTLASIATTGSAASNPPLVLSNAALLPGRGVSFDFPTAPGVTYTIQFNPDLSNPSGWTPLLISNAIATSLAFTNPPPAGANPGFYRAFHN